MQASLRELRHPKERRYGTIMLVAGALIWLLILAALVASLLHSPGNAVVLLIEAAVILGVLALAKMFYRAYLFGHAVLVSPTQFPRLYESVASASHRLGLAHPPQTFVYNSHGLTNALAMRVLRHRMVLLTSALIDVEHDRQVDFVVAHEVGHHVAGHLGFWRNTAKYPAHLIPFLGRAYSRARELTADRIGAHCVGDVEVARGALAMMACGSARLDAVLDTQAFREQEALVPPVTGFLLHIVSGYPRLTRRVQEVETFLAGQSGSPALTERAASTKLTSASA
jgi:Zn-dependent protease with chaperone function